MTKIILQSVVLRSFVPLLVLKAQKILKFNSTEQFLDNYIKKKKKRYAYLVVENVGNFQMSKDGIVVLTHIAWAAITTSAH